MQFPEKLKLVFERMNVKLIFVPDGEGTPIWWGFKMNAGRKDGYKRSFAKLELWNLEQYEKIVFFDSDGYIRGPMMATLFQLTQGVEIAAVEDLYMVRDKHILHYFNAGMFVLKPGREVYLNMVEVLNGTNDLFNSTSASLKSATLMVNGKHALKSLNLWNKGLAEQDFLNFYYGAGWKRLPLNYNDFSLLETSIFWHCKFWHRVNMDLVSKLNQKQITDSMENAKKLLESDATEGIIF